MAFKHACFVSYRHGKEEQMNMMIDDICKALSGELELWVGEDLVYRDKTRLKAGDFFDEALENALYHSVCMIVIYTPTYFDMKYTYCAREFKAMEKIEKHRLKLLPPDENEHGLIIPIVLRGAKYSPKEIKQRQWFDFRDFLLSDREMNKHPYYASEIKKIAECITYRCDMFAKLGDSLSNLFKDFDGFKFPSAEEIMPWLKKVTANRLPFVGREEFIS